MVKNHPPKKINAPNRIKMATVALWDLIMDWTAMAIFTRREPEVTLLISDENTPRLRPKTGFPFSLDCSTMLAVKLDAFWLPSSRFPEKISAMTSPIPSFGPITAPEDTSDGAVSELVELMIVREELNSLPIKPAIKQSAAKIR